MRWETADRPFLEAAFEGGSTLAIWVVFELLLEYEIYRGLLDYPESQPGAESAGALVFPWLLAAFAWSFDRRLPLWLVASGGAIVVVAIWVLVLPSLPPAGQPRTLYVCVPASRHESS